jgi:hypothetical protein
MADSTAPTESQHSTAVVFRTVLGAPNADGWWRIEIEGLSERVWSIFKGFYWKPGEPTLRIGSWSIFDTDHVGPRFSEELPLTGPHLESAFRAVWDYLEPRLRAASPEADS